MKTANQIRAMYPGKTINVDVVSTATLWEQYAITFNGHVVGNGGKYPSRDAAAKVARRFAGKPGYVVKV